MRSRWFLWLVAVLIGTALALPPLVSAAEKKAAQPCGAAGEMKKEEKKETKKEAKKAVKKAVKKEAKKAEKGMEKMEGKMEEKKK